MQFGLDFNLVEELVAGVDEVGRGPLCGPVVTAAVILDPARPIEGLNDSKKLTEARREKLFDEIREKALAWCIARAEVEEIDQLNILHATMLAMQRAVQGLSVTPKLALIDGNRCPKLAVPSAPVVGGDAQVPAIAAAEIDSFITSPSLPVMTAGSRVASLSKRTTEGTLRPVPGVGAIGAMSGPARGTDVMKHTTRSVRRWLSRETTRAGRRLSPDRSVNGKRVRTMLPKANI